MSADLERDRLGLRIGYIMEAGVPDLRQSAASGAANHVRHTVTELRRLGHCVRVLARLDDRIWASDDLEQYRPVQVPGMDRGPRRLGERAVRRVQSQLGLPYISHFDSRRFAAACVSELRGVDVLYERMGWMGLGGSIAASQLGIPHVLEVNGDLLSELALLGMQPRWLQRQVSRMLMGRMIRRAAHSVATGEGWRARHVEQWHVDRATTSVVENGTAMVDLLSRERLRSFRTDLTIRGPLHVAYVGSFDPWQGLPLLLAAVGRVIASGVDIRLVLAGSGPQQSALEAAAVADGLARHVRFAGHLPLPALAGLLCECDVGVCLYSGRAEYSGLKILDYKAAGLATIAAGEAGQPAVIQHERTGLIIRPNDVDALCGALRRMGSSLVRTSQMGRTARIESEACHSWASTAQALERVLRRVLRASGETAVVQHRPAPRGRGGLRAVRAPTPEQHH